MKTAVTILCLLGAIVAGTRSIAFAIEDGTETMARPEIGRLVYRLPDGRYTMCTGTLIASNFVLTAAHCILYSTEHPARYVFAVDTSTGPKKYAVAQIHNFGPARSWGDKFPSEEELYGVQQTPTPIGRGNNDVALVQLAESVPPDVASPSGVATWYVNEGTLVTVFGYGHGWCHGVVPGGDNVKRYGSWTYQVEGWNRTNPQRIKPFGYVCEGDSGGPGVLGGADNNGDIWGVASTGSASWDTYGDVVWFRPQMEQIVTGTPLPSFRKHRPDESDWSIIFAEPR